MVFKELPEFEAIRSRDPLLIESGAGEVLSYLIVRSKAFKDWFDSFISYPYKIDVNLDNVANMITGNAIDNQAFLSEIISGPFDADKLDYIPRDSYFSGLKLPIDIERLFYTITLFKHSDGKVHLALKSYVPAEQIFFSKTMLFAAVYHHQKVKACDSMMEAICEYAQRNPANIRDGNNLQSPVNFLELTDNELLDYEATSNSTIKQRLKDLVNRKLFKRACTITKATVSNWKECYQYDLIKRLESKAELDKLRSLIHAGLPEKLKNQYGIHDIWVSLPEIPPFQPEGDEIKTFIVERNGELMRIDDLFPISGWLAAYGDRKWCGHVFCPPDTELRRAVYRSSVEVFEQSGLKLNDSALSYCGL